MKILNLYAGIGGNRKLWGDKHEVTAVEIDPKIAEIYQDFFPNDKVIVADAHQFLLEHFKEFDFIWSSPPCPTHSGANNFLNAQGVIRYPDMGLWQEIIFLKHFFKGKWIVENVKSYYEPMFNPQLSGRHFFWANFIISDIKKDKNISVANARATTRRSPEDDFKTLSEYHGFDLTKFDVNNKRQMLRNCVVPKLGLHVFRSAFKDKQTLLK